MKPDKLFDLLGRINDSEINEAMSTDSSDKLRKLKRQRHRFPSAVFTRYAAVAACFMIILTGSVALPYMLRQGPEPGPNPGVQIISPIMTVSSVAEMEKYLKFSMAVSAVYSPKAYAVYHSDGTYNMGQIEYFNGVIFRKAVDMDKCSGISNGKVIASYQTGGVAVTLSSYDNYLYTEWNENGYSYSISGQNIDRSTIESMTADMINMENNQK